MPTLYVDRPFSNAIREKAKEIERRSDDEACVSDRDALYTMLSEEAQDRIERRRKRASDF